MVVAYLCITVVICVVFCQNGADKMAFLERFRWCRVVEKVAFGDGFDMKKAPGDAEGVELEFW